MLAEIPPALKTVSIVVIVLVIFACLAVLMWPKYDNRPDDKVGPRTAQLRAQRRASKRMGAHDTRMGTHGARMGDPDKPPYQRADITQPPTGELDPPRKLPGQDRLTRISGTGMDAQDRDWAEPPDAVPAGDPDHLSGATPPFQRLDPPLAQEEPPPLQRDDPTDELLAQPPPTSAMPALGRPAVPGAPAGHHAAPPGPTAPQPGPRDSASAPDHTTMLPMAHETRQQRRERMERLALERAEQDRPESP